MLSSVILPALASLLDCGLTVSLFLTGYPSPPNLLTPGTFAAIPMGLAGTRVTCDVPTCGPTSPNNVSRASRLFNDLMAPLASASQNVFGPLTAGGVALTPMCPENDLGVNAKLQNVKWMNMHIGASLTLNSSNRLPTANGPSMIELL